MISRCFCFSRFLVYKNSFKDFKNSFLSVYRWKPATPKEHSRKHAYSTWQAIGSKKTREGRSQDFSKGEAKVTEAKALKKEFLGIRTAKEANNLWMNN